MSFLWLGFRALADKKNANESNVYFDLLSTLSAFTQQFNVQVLLLLLFFITNPFITQGKHYD